MADGGLSTRLNTTDAHAISNRPTMSGDDVVAPRVTKSGTHGVLTQWRSQKFSTAVAFLTVHSRSSALPSRPYSLIKKRHDIIYRLNEWPITLRNHIPKNYVFSRQGVRTRLTPLVWLRHCSDLQR